MRCRILVFAKAPVPGRVKTRLAPLLGSEGAAALARSMFEKTCVEASAVRDAEVEVCVSPEPTHPDWTGVLPAEIATSAQGEGDLGERLARAARRTIEEGRWPVLIGTDCPELDRERLSAACRALAANEAFIHPTEDGGYALLAVKRFSALLFTDISWSGPEVASCTMQRLDSLGWRYRVGDVLRDIDEPADYEAYLRASA